MLEVQTGEKRTVNVAPGEYHLLVRYGGDPGGYTYSRGDPFRVEETAIQHSVIAITLHKVVGGNYSTRPTSKDDFDKVYALPGSSEKAASTGAQLTGRLLGSGGRPAAATAILLMIAGAIDDFKVVEHPVAGKRYTNIE